MEIDIVGRGVQITDRFREYVTEKAEKVSHLAERALVFEIKLSRLAGRNGTAGDDKVELTLVGPGPVVRAEATAADKYAAFDIAIGRLLERVRRAKGRRKVHRGGAHRTMSLHDAAAAGFAHTDVTPISAELATGAIPVQADAAAAAAEEEDEYCPVVIRTKTFASVPMTTDDALYYMELVGHDFYLFIDAETERPSVVYRRKGWDYGVIQLDDNAEELQEAATAARKTEAFAG
jgi:ribosomal subunit interface protein